VGEARSLSVLHSGRISDEQYSSLQAFVIYCCKTFYNIGTRKVKEEKCKKEIMTDFE
jgi:hypothetical protein